MVRTIANSNSPQFEKIWPSFGSAPPVARLILNPDCFSLSLLNLKGLFKWPNWQLGEQQSFCNISWTLQPLGWDRLQIKFREECLNVNVLSIYDRQHRSYNKLMSTLSPTVHEKMDPWRKNFPTKLFNRKSITTQWIGPKFHWQDSWGKIIFVKMSLESFVNNCVTV